ncbi:class II aldolase/adducin family protein [Oceanobacillus timonensis]|uniref:class II aldolase/adducin family protein n=1 Tax=Oceanobacillus timonensis TaxID=1926285 RepID=UPI0009BBDC0B|nr:class II aldolase/adducin family protein [Oceanobacillus timonensis]
MNKMDLDKLYNETIWVAQKLFDRGKVSGSSANMSFKYEDKIYITASNTCFGNLTKEDFSIVDLNSNVLNEKKPSKEYPMHLSLYNKHSSVNCVIHTHSTFSTYWACKKTIKDKTLIPSPTPYLEMKVGNLVFVPYADPGSVKLFTNFDDAITDSTSYLLENHGPIVGDKSIFDAFYKLEELEEAAKNAWLVEHF